MRKDYITNSQKAFSFLRELSAEPEKYADQGLEFHDRFNDGLNETLCYRYYKSVVSFRTHIDGQLAIAMTAPEFFEAYRKDLSDLIGVELREVR